MAEPRQAVIVVSQERLVRILRDHLAPKHVEAVISELSDRDSSKPRRKPSALAYQRARASMAKKGVLDHG